MTSLEDEKMIRGKRGIILGDGISMTYVNDEYSFDDFITLFTDSGAKVDSVIVKISERPRLNLTMSFQGFMGVKDAIVKRASYPGKTTVKIIGGLRGTRISLSMNPKDVSDVVFTSNSDEVELIGDIIKK